MGKFRGARDTTYYPGDSRVRALRVRHDLTDFFASSPDTCAFPAPDGLRIRVILLQNARCIRDRQIFIILLKKIEF